MLDHVSAQLVNHNYITSYFLKKSGKVTPSSASALADFSNLAIIENIAKARLEDQETFMAVEFIQG